MSTERNDAKDPGLDPGAAGTAPAMPAYEPAARQGEGRPGFPYCRSMREVAAGGPPPSTRTKRQVPTMW